MDIRDSLFTRGISRRDVLRLMAGVGVAAALSRSIDRSAAATGPGTYRTTTALNLRSGAGLNHPVLLVMPAGATAVDYDGQIVSGFRSVDYNGTVGWAYDAYLVLVTDPVIIGTAKTTAAVNQRSGPGLGYAVLQVVPAGAWVEISATVQNGFRYVKYGGVPGWIYDAYVGGSITGPFTTTAPLNLRTGPGLNYSVILAMPAGATVIDYDGVIVNGYRGVDYNGTIGWASAAYLV
jgi:uncharacterized protein YraI